MGRTVTLLQLRTRIREATDTENDPHKGNDYLDDIINSEATELHGALVQIDEDIVNEKTQTIITTGTDTYQVASDHLRHKSLEYETASGYWEPLRLVSFKDRLCYQDTSGYAVAYRLVGAKLVLYPTPTTGQTYRHVYIPTQATLTQDTDTIDGLNGFDDLLVWKCSMRVALREGDTDQASNFKSLYDQTLQRITALAGQRAIYENAVIQDVEDYSDDAMYLRPYYRSPRP
jgi:hypothetical protein